MMASVSAASVPLFVHSSFRVSSTWFWTKLRAQPSVIAYYDIFHERLATETAASIAAFGTGWWHSHHPETEPYFEEYLPLVQPGGGIKDYSEAMAFRQFVPAGGLYGDLPADACRYVAGLISHADGRGLTPVLTCARSLGRLAGLRRAFGGRHILLVRNLHHQWLSYLEQANSGSYYFQVSVMQVLANGRHDPLLDRLYRECLTRIECNGGDTILRFVSLDAFLRAFLGVHLYLYAAALPLVDAVVDVTACAAAAPVRNDTAARLAAVTGLALDIADVRDKAILLPSPQGDFAAAAEGLIEMIAHQLGLTDGAPPIAFAAGQLAQAAEAHARSARIMNSAGDAA
jgi:hypothetical protein